MKYFSILVFILLFLGCKNSSVKIIKETTFYVGTYTQKESKGIYKYSISKDGKLKNMGLAATIINPSFLAKSKDQKNLFAISEINENETGYVYSYEIKNDSLQMVSKQESGGAHPCFIAVSKDNYIITANYTGGNVGLLKTTKTGKVAPISFIQQHIGKGSTERQTAPHAHSTWFHPTKNEVISIDLGTNELWFSTIDTTKNELVYTSQKKLKMLDGAGPRHLTFHPNNKWIYVLNELNNTVSLVKNKEGIYYVDTSISMLPKGSSEYSNGADIHISNDGKFLYASNRGHNSIVIYEVNSKNGVLKLIGFESVKGVNPRSFSLTPSNKFLIVANQDTNNLISFERNQNTGLLTFVSETQAPNPVCVLF